MKRVERRREGEGGEGREIESWDMTLGGMRVRWLREYMGGWYGDRNG